MPITFIINMFIAEGIVLDEFKAAKVKTIFKKGCRSEVGNYKPVGILGIISKILERAVYKQLESFFT